MTEIAFSSDLDVELIDYMAKDDSVIRAAKVSTLNDLTAEEMDEVAKLGFIGFLMKNRHGSPFEHTAFTWRIKAPIFVWREFMRHRIASYNEQSGRYSVMPAEFYIPDRNRNLIQVGKPGHYDFMPGTDAQYYDLIDRLKKTCNYAYIRYQVNLDDGIAKEVARMALPVNIYSTAYVTMNSRGLMNFLSLRVKSPDSTYVSYPMWEINEVANQMEDIFEKLMPVTHEQFVKYGRVQP